MDRKQQRCYKAMYFDLSINALKQFFSQKNPKGAYKKIQNYFKTNYFSHEQYSGYHSTFKATDLEIFQLTQKMRRIFPWLEKCVNHFEVTDVGENHDLMVLFHDNIAELE